MSTKTKTLAKALHTVSVLANLAAYLMDRDGRKPLDAMDRALDILGYDALTMDPENLRGKAMAVLAKMPQVSLRNVEDGAPAGDGWLCETGSQFHNKWTRPRPMGGDESPAPLTAPALDLSKLDIKRIRFSTTQGEVRLTYDGKILGQWGDQYTIEDGTGVWHGLDDAHWIKVATTVLDCIAKAA